MTFVVRRLNRSNGVSSLDSTKRTIASHGRLFNSFHLKTHHATDTETTMKIIASLECGNIEPHAPKTPKTPWKTRTGSNTVIAKITISIAIQSAALRNSLMDCVGVFRSSSAFGAIDGSASIRSRNRIRKSTLSGGKGDG